MPIFAALTLASMMVLAVGGCAESPTLVHLSEDGRILRKPASAELVAKPDSPIPDVPMPVGFVFIETRSSSQSVGHLRRVDHVYQGLASRGQVAEYYRRVLPASGWQRGSDEMAGPSHVLRYMKDREALEIRITESNSVATVRVRLSDTSTSPVSSLP